MGNISGQATHTQSRSHTVDILVYKGSVYIQPRLKLYTGWKEVVMGSGSVKEKDSVKHQCIERRVSIVKGYKVLMFPLHVS